MACTPAPTASRATCSDLLLVERDQHRALRVHPLHDLEAHVAVDQRRVLLEEQVVGLRPVDAADLVDVAEALRGQQRAARAGALQDGVDRDRGAVQEQPRGVEARAGLADAVLDAGDQPLRRGQRLAEAERAGRLVERGDVGERAADVGGQADRRGTVASTAWSFTARSSKPGALPTPVRFAACHGPSSTLIGRQVGDEAVRRRVRDEERQLRVLGRALRGDAAGPEHRHDAVRRRRHRAAEQRVLRGRRRSRPDRRGGSARRG